MNRYRTSVWFVIAASITAGAGCLGAPEEGSASAPLRAGEDLLIPPLSLPASLQAPEGHRAYLKLHATGTQNYICLPKAGATTTEWVFLGPQATLFDVESEQALTHYLSTSAKEGMARPTWQHSKDSSAVWAKAIASTSDPKYVAAGSIPWLLLQVTGTQEGPTGGSKLSATTYIQRVHTSGGVAPAGECPAVGAKALVPYETDYIFYRAKFIAPASVEDGSLRAWNPTAPAADAPQARAAK